MYLFTFIYYFIMLETKHNFVKQIIYSYSQIIWDKQ
jgi:hypothetical protein